MKKMKKFICFTVLLALFSTVSAGAYTYTPKNETVSDSVYMYNITLDSVVYSKNATVRKDPSYLTQIMTAIVAAENCPDWNTVVKAPAYIYNELFVYNQSHSSALPTADIVANEEVLMRDLLYAMVVRSSCEAASIVADYIGNGSIQNFVKLMNDKAAALGCTNTHFATPHGALSEENYTTAEDLFKIYKYALTIPGFDELFASTRYTIPESPLNKNNRVLTSESYLVDYYSSFYYKYATTAKHSGTSSAGMSLVSTAEKDGFSYMIVTMGAPRYDSAGEYGAGLIDQKKLYEWAFNDLRVTKILDADQSIDEVKVTLSQNKDFVLLYPESDFSFLLPNEVSVDSIQLIKNIPESIKAPVKAGDVVGTVTLMLAAEKLATVNLVAGSDLAAAPVMKAVDIVGMILTSPWTIGIFIFLVVCLIALIVYARVRQLNRRKYKTVRRRRRF